MNEISADRGSSRFAICVRADGHEDDLRVRTVYRVLPDESAARSHYVRIVDDTGEDYLYPESLFVFIEVSEPAAKALMEAA